MLPHRQNHPEQRPRQHTEQKSSQSADEPKDLRNPNTHEQRPYFERRGAKRNRRHRSSQNRPASQNMRQAKQSPDQHPLSSRDRKGRRPRRNLHPSRISDICVLVVIACLIASLVAIAITTSNKASTETKDHQGSSINDIETTQDILVTPLDDVAAEIIAKIDSDGSRTYVASREIAHDLIVTGSDVSFAGTAAYAEFANAIGSIEDGGYDVSATVIDIQTGATISYNATEEYYCASSIKAAFVCYLYEDLVDGGSVGLNELTSITTPTIVDSDNVCYASLRRTYGDQGFTSWLETIGCGYGRYDSYEDLASIWYPYLDTTQLSLIWQHIYTYLTTKRTSASENLADLFASRTTSAITDALGDTYETWGKAGWYPESIGDGIAVTVDAGVIKADRPYIVVVMCNAGENFEAITPVFSALDVLHGDL